MNRRRVTSLLFALVLICQAFATPVDLRLRRESLDNEVNSKEDNASSSTTTSTEKTNNATELNENEISGNSTQNDSYGSPSFNEPSKVDLSAAPSAPELATPDPFDDDSDESMESSPAATGGGGSNVFSLLRLATSLFPGSSGGGANFLIRNMIREYLRRNQQIPYFERRNDNDNEIEIDYSTDLKPPTLATQETDEESGSESTESDSEEDDDNAAEESVEGNGNNGSENNGNGNENNDNENNETGNDNNGNDSKQKQDPESNATDENDSDYDDEPPGGGDGQGGGILGILAGLSGGEDGQSDLGSLLATISGIVVSLSGDGIDVNALIASGIGLFVGLLSGDEQNPGEVLASYLLTSLDTITGGGSQNNGAFFGTFLSKLIKGTSALMTEGDSSEENGNGMKMTDSGGFLASFLMGLLGDMSKGSSGSSSSSQHWDRQNWEQN